MPEEPNQNSESTAKRRLKTGLLACALIVFSLTIALLAAEGVVRLVAPQQLISYRSDVFMPADTVAYKHRPNLHMIVNTGERPVTFMTDADGNRVGAKGRVEARRKVLIIGDSFMQAIQVEYENSIPGLLEERLPASLGEPVSIRNTGVSGFDPNSYAVMTRRWLAREPFDLVINSITMENDIDTAHVVQPPMQPHLAHEFQLLPDTFNIRGLINAYLYPVNDALEMRSHLFILTRHALQVMLMHLGLSPLPLPVWYYRTKETSPAWDTTATIINEVGKAADAHGVPVMFVFFPSSYQVDSVDFKRYIDGFGVDPSTIDLTLPNRKLAERLRALGRTVIDPTPALRDANRRGVRTHGRFDPHLSPEGTLISEKIIEPVAVALIKEKLKNDSLRAARGAKTKK